MGSPRSALHHGGFKRRGQRSRVQTSPPKMGVCTYTWGKPTLHGLVLHGGDVLKAGRWHVPVFADLLLLLMARGATGGGRGGERAGPPQSGLRQACQPPRLPWLPSSNSTVSRGRGSGSGCTQAWERGWCQGRCLGQGWTGTGRCAGAGGKGVASGWRGRKRSSHQSTVLLFSASGQRFAGGGRERYGEG